ncbi:MAG: type IV pilus assembly protein PilM [Patescibacteria group bacterium]|jgi:type IV pilus assembly protein PilM
MIKKQIFGLDISDHSMEALVISKPSFAPPKIVSYSRIILEGEVVKNGVIKNKAKLAENITKLLNSAQPQPIKTPHCILSLPESQVFTTIFKLPSGLKYKEVKSTIPYKAEEVIPFKSGEVYFDFKTISVQGATQEIFYAAVPMKIVDGYVDILRSLNLEPVAFDLESVSLGRVLLPQTKKSGNAKLLIDIGARTTNLNVFDRAGIRQSLVINIAGERFSKAVATKLNIDLKQAEELKKKNGFDPKKQEGKVLLVLQNEFKRIIDETKKLIEYYQTQNQRQIDEIILVGGSALLPKLDQYLADNLGIQVNVGKPLDKVVDPQGLTGAKSKAVLFANVAGLALRAITKNPVSDDINLLPVKSRRFTLLPGRMEKRAWRFIYIRLAIFTVLIIAFFGVFSLRNSGKDLYQKFFPQPKYETTTDSGIDANVLDALREKMLTPTTTPTTTPDIVLKKIKIKKTTSGFLNVRSGAGASYSSVGQVNSEAEFDVLDEQNGWYQIKFSGENLGWVSGSFVDLIEVKPEVLGEAIELPAKVKIRETELGYLNLREGPASSSTKIGEALSGQEYVVLAEENGWYKIQFNQETVGWVSSLYVDKSE